MAVERVVPKLSKLSFVKKGSHLSWRRNDTEKY